MCKKSIIFTFYNNLRIMPFILFDETTENHYNWIFKIIKNDAKGSNNIELMLKLKISRECKTWQCNTVLEHIWSSVKQNYLMFQILVVQIISWCRFKGPVWNAVNKRIFPTLFSFIQLGWYAWELAFFLKDTRYTNKWCALTNAWNSEHWKFVTLSIML